MHKSLLYISPLVLTGVIVGVFFTNGSGLHGNGSAGQHEPASGKLAKKATHSGSGKNGSMVNKILNDIGKSANTGVQALKDQLNSGGDNSEVATSLTSGKDGKSGGVLAQLADASLDNGANLPNAPKSVDANSLLKKPAQPAKADIVAPADSNASGKVNANSVADADKALNNGANGVDPNSDKGGGGGANGGNTPDTPNTPVNPDDPSTPVNPTPPVDPNPPKPPVNPNVDPNNPNTPENNSQLKDKAKQLQAAVTAFNKAKDAYTNNDDVVSGYFAQYASVQDAINSVDIMQSNNTLATDVTGVKKNIGDDTNAKTSTVTSKPDETSATADSFGTGMNKAYRDYHKLTDLSNKLKTAQSDYNDYLKSNTDLQSKLDSTKGSLDDMSKQNDTINSLLGDDQLLSYLGKNDSDLLDESNNDTSFFSAVNNYVKGSDVSKSSDDLNKEAGKSLSDLDTYLNTNKTYLDSIKFMPTGLNKDKTHYTLGDQPNVDANGNKQTYLEEGTGSGIDTPVADIISSTNPDSNSSSSSSASSSSSSASKSSSSASSSSSSSSADNGKVTFNVTDALNDIIVQ